MITAQPVYKALLTTAVLYFLLLLCSQSTKAQDRCGTMEYHQHLMETDPLYKADRERIESFTAKYLANKDNRERREDAQTIIIPVVVHIVWNTPDQNIPDERVHQQMKILNEDFNRRNADAANTPAVFAAAAGSYNIEFCLAPWQDEQGTWHDPITRTQTNRTFFTLAGDEVKRFSTGGHDIVNPGEYLNFWVCPLKTNLLGYAKFPGGDPNVDGVAMTTYSFGLSDGGPTGAYDRGRTTTHEVGHWLNLYHLSGDRTCGDDLVDDTPQQRSQNYGAPVFPHRPNDCDTNNPNGDMFMNFMDYTDDKLMNMFSKGQVDRSMALFTSTGNRETFRYSGFLCDNSSPGLKKGCPCTVPENPRVINNKNDRVEIAWSPDKTSQKEYEIRYRKSSGDSWNTWGTTEDTLVEITGLERSRLYMFQVRSICGSGLTSDWRSLVAGTVEQNAVCDNVTANLTSLSATSAEFEWTTSPAYTGFEVQYGELINNKYQNWVRLQLDPTVTTMRLNTLKPGTSYSWIVRAKCYGENIQEEIRFKTAGCATPQDLDYNILDINTVELSWNTVNLDDEISSFDIGYQEEGDPSSYVEITGVSNPHILNNLPSGKNYEWRVAANCTFGQGNWANSTFVTTNCLKPENLQVSNITGTSAKLSWDAPAGGDVTSYNVYHRPKGGNSWTTYIALQPFHTLTGLSAGYSYEVAVESICQQGGGTSQYVRTSFDTPGCDAPASELGWVSHNEAQILFTAPFPPGSDAQFRVLENGNEIWSENANGIPTHGAWIWEGMEPSKTYTAQFRVACGNGEVSDWTSYTITTKACPLPINLSHGYPAGAGDVSVNVNWQLPQGAPDLYEISLRDEAGNIIHDRATYAGSNRSVNLNGLTPSTNYIFQLNTSCSGVVETGPEYRFTTRSTANARSATDTEAAVLFSASISPNPSRDMVAVTIAQQGVVAAVAEKTTFRILDQGGRQLFYQSYDMLREQYQLSLGHLQPGIYLMETTRGGRSTINKVIIEP